MGRLMSEQSKSQPISKQMVWQAWQRVKSNKGSAGIDKVSIEKYEAEISKNLYKLWNRLTSGSYFPPPVKEVEIPKPKGGVRKLGIPTVGDRIAQMVVKNHLEPILDPIFHQNSYGYRPKKSAHEALDRARRKCWEYDWVIDMDIKGFFDNIDHALLMKALDKHTSEKWVRMYVERWLKAPVQKTDGSIEERIKGTPQGGVISPILANLFLHYAFDKWMDIHYSNVPFERYADDVIVHCESYDQALTIKSAIQKRMEACKLQLHPDKTKIVYCKDSSRRGNHKHISFTFLGYTFQPRESQSGAGNRFTSFQPAISKQAKKKIVQELRKMNIQRQVYLNIEQLAKRLNSKLLRLDKLLWEIWEMEVEIFSVSSHRNAIAQMGSKSV